MYTSKVYKDSGRIRIKLSGSNKILPHAESIRASLVAFMCSGDHGKKCCDIPHVLQLFGHSASEKIL